MTDTTLFKEVIKESGMTITAICRKAGIGRETFYNKFNGKSEFNASDIVALSETLGMSNEIRDRIFFTLKAE